MKTLNDYVEAAKTRTGFKSERKMCEALNLSSNTFNGYRKGKLPSDETMVKLAKMAHIDPETALLDLNIWRSAGTPAFSFYQKIASRMAHLCIMIFGFTLISSAAHAASVMPSPAGLWGTIDQILYITEKKASQYLRKLKKHIISYFNALGLFKYAHA